MPGGAPVSTSSVHTSPPAATTESASGRPLVTTSSGSRVSPRITITENCHSPAQNGPSVTVRPSGGADGMPGWVRTTVSTCGLLGPFRQAGAGGGPGGRVGVGGRVVVRGGRAGGGRAGGGV